MLDGQLMDRLRNWNKTRADVFNRVVVAMTEVLTAPNTVGGGGGGGFVSGGGGGNSVAARSVAAQTSPRVSTRNAHTVAVPRDFANVSRPEQESIAAKARDELSKARHEKEELQKLADVLKGKDAEAHAKAMAEVAAVSGEISVLETDLRRLDKSLQPAAPAASMAPATPAAASIVGVSSPGPAEVRARALYDFTAERDEELSLKAGDIVVVLDEEDEGWWEVVKVSGVAGGGAAGAGGAGIGAHGTGASGFVPGSYLQKIPQE